MRCKGAKGTIVQRKKTSDWHRNLTYRVGFRVKTHEQVYVVAFAPLRLCTFVPFVPLHLCTLLKEGKSIIPTPHLTY